MARILINIPRYRQGGVFTFYDSLAAYFRPNIQYNSIACDGKRNILHVFMRMTFDYFRFTTIIVFQKISLVVVNPSMVRRSFMRDAIFVILAKLLGKKVVVFWHGWDKQFAQSIGQHCLLRLARSIFVSSDTMVVLANEFRNELVKWMSGREPGSRVFVQSTVIPDSLVATLTDEMIGQRQAIEGPVVILFLSRIVSVKGVYQAIEAFALVNAKYPTTQLIIAGDGNELENVKSLLKSRHLDQAKTLGYVQGDEKRATFCESHIYVFPSQEAEGMPQSVLEAIGCGLPLVTTVLGGLTDFFLDGKMGLALSNVDPKHIADLLLKLVEDRVLRKEMALFNHRFARQHFLASKAAVRLEEIFTSVLAE